MDPLAVWLAHLRGLPVPSVVNTFVLFMPNYACAVVATLPSRVLQRLGRRLRQAQELGSYHLVELLGRGGMGEVWRGRHRLLARSAAIKLVRPELLGASSEAEARSMLRRFEQEAQATAALSSPHTIRLFDFGVTDGPHVLLRHGAARRAAISSRWFGNSARFRPTARSSCCGRSVIRSPTRTRGGSSTATSRRPISTSAGWASTTTS